MKKTICMCLLLSVLALPLCSSAFAVEAPSVAGVHSITVAEGYMLTPQSGSGSAIESRTMLIDDQNVSDYYSGAEKFTLSYTPTRNGFSLVLALSGDSSVPTADNIVYIDQNVIEAGESVAFTIYPSPLSNGVYRVYVAETDGTLTEAASFCYYAPYKLGDVDEDNRITSADAAKILESVAQLTTLTDSQRLAAKVSANGAGVTSADAALVLERVAQLITKFPIEE